MPRLTAPNGTVVVVDDATAASLPGYTPADEPKQSTPDKKPETVRRAPVAKRK